MRDLAGGQFQGSDGKPWQAVGDLIVGRMANPALTAQTDRVVSILYVLTLSDGRQVDSSGVDDPLEYLHGHDNIVPGLERKLEGRAVGDKLKVTVAPVDGYGDVEPDGVQTMPKDAFPPGVEVGMQLAMEDDEGDTVSLWVKEVTKDNVVIDFNHPLAGQTLHFDVEVVGVREASPEELEHGHVHGAHDHHHDDSEDDHHHHH
ncbi:MAG: peptidylprolyl isomerase [Polyangiaceae bacterium]|nr:peptidylprolyl isomerase [Polyangiaceae bacterium]